MDAPASLWIVLDAEGRPEFAAGWREAAHEHIKDAIEIEVDETASRWVVREYVPVAEVTRLRAEVQRLIADQSIPPNERQPIAAQQRDAAWAQVDALQAEVQRLRAEVESLRHTKEAFDEWLAKTDWVQKSAAVNELGKHRADVLRDRIEALRAALKPFAAIDLTTNQAVDAMDVLRARRALKGGE